MRYLLLAVLAPLACCGPKASTLDDFQTRPITLPGGQVIRAETMISNIDLMRGLMFRTSLAVSYTHLRNASNAPVSANGRANTECSNLIISSVSRNRFQKPIPVFPVFLVSLVFLILEF